MEGSRIMDSFGSYIYQLRKDRKLSMRKLEELSGVSNAYISQMETGKRSTPSPEILKKIHEPLGVTYEEIMQKAGYIVYLDGEEKIKELERQLKEAHDRIRKLENGYDLISKIVKNHKEK